MGAAPGVPAVAQAPDGWEAGVQALLDRRAGAVAAGDREAFLDTLDPLADETFRRDEARAFDGLASVPLDSYDLRLRTDDVHDLSVAVPDDRGGADEIRIPLVEERLRITGVDDRDGVSDLWYTFVRRGAEWFVNADDDVADLGLITQVHLWSSGPVVFTEGARTVVMSSPEDRERAATLLEITEEGFDRLRQTLDWAAPPKVLVVLPQSTKQLEEILQTTFDLSNFVAFASADVDRDEAVQGWGWTAPRVYAQESNLAGHSRDFQVETLHHELVHVVAFDHAGPFVPNWLHEGQADFLALGRPSEPGTLPLDHQFVTGGRDRILRSYRESTSAAAFLAEAKGADAVAALFDVTGARRVVAGTWRYHLDQAMREVYGAPLDQFEADWDGGR